MPSSVIFAMRYEPEREELLIAFRNGRRAYRYFGVLKEEWEAFLEAESKGAYLNRVFKQREHPYESAEEELQPSGRTAGGMPLEWGEIAVPRKDVRRVEVMPRGQNVRAS
jgi:hypothetical protein